ncbi:MAG: cytochrome b/b6 domain-containing protein [Candidatus Eisenbacteria bacterium]
MDNTAIPLVYVWEFEVRLYHWVNAACVALLVATGFIIGRPLVRSRPAPKRRSATGSARCAFFTSSRRSSSSSTSSAGSTGAGAETACPLAQLHPPSRRSIPREIGEVLKVDILQAQSRPIQSIGHNALAGFTYFVSFIAFLFQSVTGFGMYAAMSNSWLPQRFAWIVPMMGGDFAVRQWHHLMMWFFIVFVMVHVYLVFYHDYVEGRGVISSMAGGWKFVEKDSKR